jgi:hypothetical protein
MLTEIASFAGPALFAQLMLTVKDRSVFVILRFSSSKKAWSDAHLRFAFWGA